MLLCREGYLANAKWRNSIVNGNMGPDKTWIVGVSAFTDDMLSCATEKHSAYREVDLV